MICESCNQNVATVHLTEIVNKKKKELHLCEECAREKGVSYKASFSVHDFLGSLVKEGGTPAQAAAAAASASAQPKEKGAAAAGAATAEQAGSKCPSCGLTFAEFRASGRLGCPADYVHFKRGLQPLLEKIHGATQHTGKVPVHAGDKMAKQNELALLRQELNQAIQREEYEKAAELRDRIRKLEERS